MVKKLSLLFFLLMTGSSLSWAKNPATNDPTKPLFKYKKPVTIKKTKAKQPLTAIFTRGKQRFAIIEGKKYRAGEYYQGSRIVKILQDKVLLRSNQGSFQLALIPKVKK